MPPGIQRLPGPSGAAGARFAAFFPAALAVFQLSTAARIGRSRRCRSSWHSPSAITTLRPVKREVTRSYRERMRSVHPDHGGAAADASRAIRELNEARRILTTA